MVITAKIPQSRQRQQDHAQPQAAAEKSPRSSCGPLQHALGGGDGGLARVELARLPQGFAEGLEDRLGHMVVIRAIGTWTWRFMRR